MTSLSLNESRWQRLLDSCIFIAILMIAWQLLFMIVGSSGVAPPVQTIINSYNLLGDADFWPNVFSTGSALLWALLIASTVGIFLGLLLGLNRLAVEVAEPILVLIYSTPKIMFYPIFMLIFGIAGASKVAFGVFHGIVPVVLFTMTAVQNIKPILFKTSRAMRLSPWQFMCFVAAPAVVPEIFTGLRIGFARVMIGVLLCEMFAARSGIGQMLMKAMSMNRLDILMPLTFLIVVFAVTVNFSLLWVDERLRHS